MTGLYAAFIVCLITSVFGGRPGMISGATGALAVVMVSIVVSKWSTNLKILITISRITSWANRLNKPLNSLELRRYEQSRFINISLYTNHS
jgi:hypothetical protein